MVTSGDWLPGTQQLPEALQASSLNPQSQCPYAPVKTWDTGLRRGHLFPGEAQ